ncbi:dUTP diphosphatase [Vagococcus carniphilus]|uniref:dUTP diphosphatase n=1 Tax=Vagococcus carniphilus TaxID=218144 RepID=UPI00288C64D7|nr:dUTP diphosphatase [Vagococcus carniphilus]MDT2813763.1 dUTP diphosphatase [Vagococcus carniphilus]
MNFKKLQTMQLELDNSILSAKPKMTAEERFNKTLVALSVETAEVANCAERFKFWKDNKGKIDEDKFDTWVKDGSNNEWYEYFDKDNNILKITKEQAHKLTLVEEASDCLHFILSLANQIGYEIENDIAEGINIKFEKTEWNFLELQFQISILYGKVKEFDDSYKDSLYIIIKEFLEYISMLGITTQELEQVYYEKNEENYRRLREGY